MKVNRPQVVGKYTKDLVYERLAPGIMEELESRNPKGSKGAAKVQASSVGSVWMLGTQLFSSTWEPSLALCGYPPTGTSFILM